MVDLSSTQIIVPGVGEMAQWVRVLAMQACAPSTHVENWAYTHARACVEGGRAQQLMAKLAS